jgi:hypothetical protein
MFSNLFQKILGESFEKDFRDTKMTENLLKKILGDQNGRESFEKRF